MAIYVSDRVPEVVIGDPGRFRQIITNLVGNSIKVSYFLAPAFLHFCLIFRRTGYKSPVNLRRKPLPQAIVCYLMDCVYLFQIIRHFP